MNPLQKLLLVKLLHTLAWAFFAACIVAIPVASHARDFRLALLLMAVVLAEVLILLRNGGSCPLTAVAARYTADRAENFDIFLPLWLARHNKRIFGALYVLALLCTGIAWAIDRAGAS